MIIKVCSAIFLPALLGFLIIAVIFKDEQNMLLGEHIGFSFPLGAGILTLQMFLLGILRVPLTLFNTATPLLLEITALIMWMRQTKITFFQRPTPGLLNEIISSRSRRIKNILFIILFAWISMKLVSVFLEAGLRPIFSRDAWAVWSAAAKVFYDSHSLLLNAPPLDFFGRSAVSRIISYPLHSNLLQVWISLWIGSFDDVMVKFYNPVYLFSMTVCFYFTALREADKLTALTLLLMILSSPLLSYHAIDGNSDLMLGTYLLLASLCFLKCVRGDTAASLFITGIFSAEALWTKQEAFFFIAPFILSVMVYLKFNAKNGAAKHGYLVLLAPFGLMIPWCIFTLYYKLAWGEMAGWIRQLTTFSFGADPNRINSFLTFHPEIITGYIYWLVSLNNFNVMILFVPLLLISRNRLSMESLYILFPIACYMLFFMVIYIFTSYYAWFLLGTIFNRNILTCFPVICLLVLLLLKKDTGTV